MNLTLQETLSQYDALKQTYDYMVSKKEEILAFYHKHSFNSHIFTGCGSSFEISRSSSFSFANRMNVKSCALAAGDIMINYKNYATLLDNAMICVTSRSGSTSEIVKALDAIKNYYTASVLSIICVKNSSVSQKSDFVLELPWAFDESVCQTRTVTNLYAANLMLTAFIANNEKLLGDIRHAIETGDNFLLKWKDKIDTAASREWDNVVILSDGEICGLSQEGALAFKEICNTNSNFYHLLDVRHGPIVKINSNTLVIAAFSDQELIHQKDLVSDLVKKGARVIVYSPEPLNWLDDDVFFICSGFPLDSAACGVHFINICQIASLKIAEITGVNPDTPENLSPWIEI